jgi:hypothetical protein
VLLLQALLTDHASRPQPDFHIVFTQVLTNAVPPSFIAAQARASQAYWSGVLAAVSAGTAPYNFTNALGVSSLNTRL